ncbi:hypothetical protein GCM10011368_16100 [Hyunsoonleella pacifica]|nr:hypothetical protein GCM10011368_16100 [Hyunsoonleella pacifica]
MIFFLIYGNKIDAQTTVITGLNRPIGLVLNGNNLYISEIEGNKISKIDITATTPTATDVVTGLNRPIGLALNGNDLYIAEQYANKISKIDINATTPTATDVVTGLYFPAGLALNGNDLYITEFTGDKISKIDITATTATATNVVTLLNRPDGLVLNGNDLYISESGGNKISKFSITSLSINNISLQEKISLYPNPSHDFIEFTGLTSNMNYNILNALGVEISKGTISKHMKIDISNFTDGFYFLKFDNGRMFKFMKR